MTLAIAGQALSDPTGLSTMARLCLSLIDGGTPWLQWAIVQPGARYAFPDETALVEAVQTGLHGNPLTLLPGLGLTIGPARLMALDEASLQALARAEASGKSTAAAARLLDQCGLLTAAGLTAGAAWLAGQGAADSPLFQVLTLQDRVALAALAAGETQDAALAKAASAFARAQARTPTEFIDYRRIFLAVAGRMPDSTAAQREAEASRCIHILLPWMFIALDCPSLPPPVTVGAAGRSLAEWFAAGRLLGFASAAGGARQICERTGFTPDTADVGGLIAGYLHQATTALQADPLSVSLNQDGRSASLRAGGAVVSLNHAGDLSLDDFQPA